MCAVYASVMCELSCEMCMDMGSQGRFKNDLHKGQKKKRKEKDEDIGHRMDSKCRLKKKLLLQ